MCRIIGYRARRFLALQHQNTAPPSPEYTFSNTDSRSKRAPKTDQTALSKERRKPISNAEPIIETQLKWPINPHLLHPKTKQSKSRHCSLLSPLDHASTASLRQIVIVFVCARILNVDPLEFSKQIAVPARTPNLLATEAFQIHV